MKNQVWTENVIFELHAIHARIWIWQYIVRVSKSFWLKYLTTVENWLLEKSCNPQMIGLSVLAKCEFIIGFGLNTLLANYLARSLSVSLSSLKVKNKIINTHTLKPNPCITVARGTMRTVLVLFEFFSLFTVAVACGFSLSTSAYWKHIK